MKASASSDLLMHMICCNIRYDTIYDVVSEIIAFVFINVYLYATSVAYIVNALLHDAKAFRFIWKYVFGTILSCCIYVNGFHIFESAKAINWTLFDKLILQCRWVRILCVRDDNSISLAISVNLKMQFSSTIYGGIWTWPLQILV